MSDTDVPVAVVGVLHNDGKFLLIQRADGVSAGGYWAPPSGRVELGESPKQAVIREMKEELGLIVAPERHVWTCRSHDGHFTLHWWLVQAQGCDVRPSPREVAAARWCSTQEILQLSPTFEDDVRFFVEVWPTLS